MSNQNEYNSAASRLIVKARFTRTRSREFPAAETAGAGAMRAVVRFTVKILERGIIGGGQGETPVSACDSQSPICKVPQAYDLTAE